MMVNEHAGDGSDESGRMLPITIRIGPDGRVYFHDITEEMLPVARALCPEDRTLSRRIEAAARYEKKKEAHG